MKARYNATGNYLEEQPGMGKPICINGVSPNLCSSIRKNSGLKECECKIYQDHVASLRCRIPCHPSCVGKWSDGQEVEEGKDYNLTESWEIDERGNPIKRSGRFTAFPIQHKQAQPIIMGIGEETGQEEMQSITFKFDDVLEMLIDFGNSVLSAKGKGYRFDMPNDAAEWLYDRLKNK